MSDSKSLDTLFKLVHAIKRNVYEHIETLELDIVPMNVRVLKIISKKPQCTAVDIAHFLDRDKAQVTRLLSSLINQELIVKEPNPEDKRSQCLRVTEAGQAIMAKITDADITMLEKMHKGIATEGLEQFYNTARQMTKNLT